MQNIAFASIHKGSHTAQFGRLSWNSIKKKFHPPIILPEDETQLNGELEDAKNQRKAGFSAGTAFAALLAVFGSLGWPHSGFDLADGVSIIAGIGTTATSWLGFQGHRHIKAAKKKLATEQA